MRRKAYIRGPISSPAPRSPYPAGPTRLPVPGPASPCRTTGILKSRASQKAADQI